AGFDHTARCAIIRVDGCRRPDIIRANGLRAIDHRQEDDAYERAPEEQTCEKRLHGHFRAYGDRATRKPTSTPQVMAPRRAAMRASPTRSNARRSTCRRRQTRVREARPRS